MGALLHAPWHSTSMTVNLPSLVVSPGLMPPRWEQTVSRMSYAPRSMQGVVVHTWTKCSPMGSLFDVNRPLRLVGEEEGRRTG